MMLTALLTYHSFQKIVVRPDKKKEAMFSKAFLTVQDGFVKPSPQALQRSASFRVSSAKRGSRTDLSRCVQMVLRSV